jgi:hypothetical protein
MNSTHPASVYSSHQPLHFEELPKELIVMIAEKTDNPWDIVSLRRVSKYLRDVIPTRLISETAFLVMPTSGSISRMAQLVQMQSVTPNCDLERVPAIVFENVWPIPADEFGLDVNLTDQDHWEDNSDDEQPPYLNTYLRFMDACHAERGSTQLRQTLADTLRNFHGIKEMTHISGFHKSRPIQERATVEELQETVLLYNDHEPEDFADEMWRLRLMMFEPYRGRMDYTGAEMFHHAIDAVLRNPKRKDKLRVYIETYSVYALDDFNQNATPIPVGQLGDVLKIKYIGHRMSNLDAIDFDLGVLHDQRINTAAPYAGLTHLTISGDGLGDMGSVHMGLLGGPSHSPDWSRLESLHFGDTQHNDQSAAFLSQQKVTLGIENVYWRGDSIQRFSKGSSLRGVKAAGVFAIEGIDQHASRVWIVACNEKEAEEVAVKNAKHCKPTVSGDAVPFVLPTDVQRYMMTGGVFPFDDEDIWAKDWLL